VVVEGLTVLLHDQWLVDARTVGIAGDDRVGAVEFEEDVFVVVDVTRCRRGAGNDFLLDSPP